MAESTDWSKPPLPPETAFGPLPPKAPWNRFLAGVPYFCIYVLFPFLTINLGMMVAHGFHNWQGDLSRASSGLGSLCVCIFNYQLFRPFKRYRVDEALTQRLRQLMPAAKYSAITVRVDSYRGPRTATRKGNDLLISQWILTSFSPEVVDYVLVRAALVNFLAWVPWFYVLCFLVGFLVFWNGWVLLWIFVGGAMLGAIAWEWIRKKGRTVNERALEVTRNLGAALAVVHFMPIIDNDFSLTRGMHETPQRERLYCKGQELGLVKQESLYG